MLKTEGVYTILHGNTIIIKKKQSGNLLKDVWVNIILCHSQQ